MAVDPGFVPWTINSATHSITKWYIILFGSTKDTLSTFHVLNIVTAIYSSGLLSSSAGADREHCLPLFSFELAWQELLPVNAKMGKMNKF